MKLLLILSFFLAGVSVKSSGQDRDNSIRSFYILMVNPDKANIADSLKIWADSIERKNLRQYYNTLKSFENSKKDGNKNWRKEIDARILETKSREKEEINFKYYYRLTYVLRAELSKLFNADYWINWRKNSLSRQSVIDVQIINHSEAFTEDLKKLGHHFKVDYILTFKNIRTDKKNGVGILKYTIQLYWTKENKVILDKEIEGTLPLTTINTFIRYTPRTVMRTFFMNRVCLVITIWNACLRAQ